MRESNVPDNIIERAVEIWCRALHRPKFDNGDQSEVGVLTMMYATANMGHAVDAAGDIDAKIEKFREILVAKLKNDRDHHGEATGQKDKYGDDERIYFSTGLCTDYGPDKVLQDAAEASGIPNRLFSWKSQVWMYPDFVSTRFGYGALDANHYPLPDGSWLITGLRGADIEAIKTAVMDGRLPELTVEPATVPTPVTA